MPIDKLRIFSENFHFSKKFLNYELWERPIQQTINGSNRESDFLGKYENNTKIEGWKITQNNEYYSLTVDNIMNPVTGEKKPVVSIFFNPNKVFFGNNYQNVSWKEFVESLDFVLNELKKNGLSADGFKVSRFDIGVNFKTENKVCHYINLLDCFSEQTHMKKMKWKDESIYFTNKSTTVIGYDKNSELKRLKKRSPYNNFFRYEIQFKRGSRLKVRGVDSLDEFRKQKKIILDLGFNQLRKILTGAGSGFDQTFVSKDILEYFTECKSRSEKTTWLNESIYNLGVLFLIGNSNAEKISEILKTLGTGNSGLTKFRGAVKNLSTMERLLECDFLGKNYSDLLTEFRDKFEIEVKNVY